jgi:DnaJ-class molecular chaperone
MGFMDRYTKHYDTSKGFGSPEEWKDSFYQRFTKEEAEEILSVDSDSPWGILEVPFTATKEEIKKAYRRMMIKWHPDKNPHNQEEATRMAKKINAAYSIIG